MLRPIRVCAFDVAALALASAALVASVSIAAAQESPQPVSPDVSIDIGKLALPSQVLLDDLRGEVKRSLDQHPDASPGDRELLLDTVRRLEGADARGDGNGAVSMHEADSLAFGDDPMGIPTFQFFAMASKLIGAENVDMAVYIDQRAEDLNPDACDRGAAGPTIGNGDSNLSISELDAFVGDLQDRIAIEGDPQNKYQDATTWAERLKFYVRNPNPNLRPQA